MWGQRFYFFFFYSSLQDTLPLLVLDFMVHAITDAIDNVKTNAIFIKMSAKN